MALFVGLAAGWALLAPPGTAPPDGHYPAAMGQGSGEPVTEGRGVAREAEAPRGGTWLVDGYNVIQVGRLAGEDREGWWRSDRRRLLLDRAAMFADPSAELHVIFDGPDEREEVVVPGRLYVHFASSADQWILARVGSAARRSGGQETCLAVVTADRPLAGRAASRGATVVSPRSFLARCGDESGAGGQAASGLAPDSGSRWGA